MDNMRIYEGTPQVLRDFLIYMEVIAGKSHNTVKEYHVDLKTFFKYLKAYLGRADLNEFDKIDISDVTVEDLEKVTLAMLYEYMYYVKQVRKNSQNTRARKVSSLRSFFKYLTVRTGVLKNNPASDLESPKIPDLLPRHLTLDESINLLSNLESQFPERDFAMLTLFLNCGLRLSELVGIDINDYKGDKLTVIGKGNRERTIYLNAACQKAINDYLAVRKNDGVIDKKAMFISKRKTRISGKMVQVIVKKALESSGLDTSRFSVHKLRHTAATLMYKHGDVDIRALQEILGHRQLSTTQIYTHVDDQHLREAANKNPLSDITRDKE